MTEKPDKSAKKPEDLAEHRARMRDDWSNLIEDLIEEGRKQGAFDDLPGRGKPLKMDKNPYGRETELAHSLLKRNDLRPAWITNRSDILTQIKVLREKIQRIWTRHEREFRYAQAEGNRGALTISWDDACREWQEQIVDLNKQIEDFNLKRPSDNLELFKLKLEEELARVGASRWLK